MHSKSIVELGAAMQAGEFSSVELTGHFIDRIERLNGDLNALITPTPDQALVEAEAADKAIRSGQAGPLTGIPLVQKDIFCTKGVKTSCGSRMLDNFVSPYDATVVERLKQAGTVSLGKANMDEFAMGSSNETSYYG
ncbi:MAG: amidase, partial [Candidatus Thiodiazotropha sp.]